MPHARIRHGLFGPHSFALAACCGLALVAAACDETFEPIAPTDLAFSVFGYLDASADTQWIRIMPIRPLKVTAPDTLDATVTLEHLASGRIVELRDSLFRFSSRGDPSLGSEGVYLHNFWTREHVEPGATYRFSATRTGKAPAEAVVEIPPDYDVAVAINQRQGWDATDLLYVTGLNDLPFLEASVHYFDGCGWGVSPIPYERRSDDDGTHVFALLKQQAETRPNCGRAWIARRELWMVGSHATWPSGGYAEDALGESARTSNVTNAVGFLGGVLTKVIPYEDCSFLTDAGTIPHYCWLRYDGETATLAGTAREPLCFGELDSVSVQLTELGRDPARFRSVLTDEAGAFVFGALEPGIPHRVWARAPRVPIDSMFDPTSWRWVYTEWEDIHTIHTDTLTFAPGEQLDYDIVLRRLIACDETHLPKP
jgi:hypothetical protein